MSWTLSMQSRSIRNKSARQAVAMLQALALIAVAGCSSLEPDESGLGGLAATSSRGWSQVNLPGIQQDAAFDAAVAAVRQWFTLEVTSPETGTVRSRMQEFDQKGGTGRIRDAAIQYRNRMRRSATVIVENTETGCVAKCAVRVQRFDTADHRVFRDQSRFDDYPSETPIDGEASVSAGKDEVWTDMPRDRQLERDILDAIKSRSGGGATTTPSDS